MSANENTPSVLQRKADAGKQEHQARSMTVAKAMRLCVAKAAADLFDLALGAIGIVVERRGKDDTAELLDDDALMALLDGPGGRVGAAVVDPILAGGLIQQQTMARVSAPVGDPRRMTATDAAMVAPLLEEVLKRAAEAVDAPEDCAALQGYSFGALAEEGRIVDMALEAHDYQVIRLTLDMAKGARQGDLTLILPLGTGPGTGLPVEDEETEADGTTESQMTDVVMHLEAELVMELSRLQFSLSEVSELKEGDVLHLPPGTFPKTRIITRTGKVLGIGTLGQVDGVRALRLDPTPVFAHQPRRRESDREDLGLPEVTAIDIGGDEGAPKGPIVFDESLADIAPIDPSDLPTLAERDETIAELSVAPGNALDDSDLPELDDFPDLADLPDLGDLEDLKSA